MPFCEDVCETICAVIIPPLGVFFDRGCGFDLLLNIILTILGYIPGKIVSAGILELILTLHPLWCMICRSDSCHYSHLVLPTANSRRGPTCFYRLIIIYVRILWFRCTNKNKTLLSSNLLFTSPVIYLPECL
jgi:uncharacterized membrane protein YqaE (UPF0057 family)